MAEKTKVLIVDDEITTIEILKKVLGDEHQLIIAKKGDEAMILARETQPDLILLDVLMPGFDGYEVCKRLKESTRTRDIPVIFLTSLETTADEERGFKVGGVDFITKPIRPFVLQSRVRTHVALKLKTDLLEKMSQEDSLTGIANRGVFDQTLVKEISRAYRAEIPLTLLMIDIDDFKTYNDHYGHQVGDEVLVKVANSIQNSLPRKTDFAARYGGEEFGCILFDTDRDGAVIVAEAIRSNIEKLQIENVAAKIETKSITVSVGGCTLIPDIASRPESLIKCADELLYQAKENGRNQAIICKKSIVAPVPKRTP